MSINRTLLKTLAVGSSLVLIVAVGCDSAESERSRSGNDASISKGENRFDSQLSALSASIVNNLKQLPKEFLAEKEKEAYEKILSMKSTMLKIENEAERTGNSSLRQQVADMRDHITSLSEQWQNYRRAQDKSDSVPEEFNSTPR